MELTKKTFTISTKAAGNRVIRFIGSDESIDRDGDTISVEGWKIDQYMKNPVVLFGHDSYSLPVAKTQAITVDRRARQLLFDIYFPEIKELASNPDTPSDHALKVDAIYNMAKLGVLNAVSVGFRGTEYEPTATGRAYTSQELMEISIVPIPANPNAVAVLRGAGVTDEIIKGVTMAENIEKGGKRLSAKTRETLDKIRETLRGCHEELEKFMAEDEPEPEPEPEAEPEKAYILEIVEKTSTDSTK